MPLKILCCCLTYNYGKSCKKEKPNVTGKEGSYFLISRLHFGLVPYLLSFIAEAVLPQKDRSLVFGLSFLLLEFCWLLSTSYNRTLCSVDKKALSLLSELSRNWEAYVFNNVPILKVICYLHNPLSYRKVRL